MKYSHKLLSFITAILLITALMLGCTVIPEEYTDGVKLDRDYPEDDMPLMDDAIVYFSDTADTNITIEYGVIDDLDDVADFYKDYFEDNEIVPDDETDKSTRYTAEGVYKNFEFEIRVTKPSGEFEEKQFETTVKIEIEFIEEALGTIDELQNTIEDDIIGFWRQESYDDGSGKVATYDLGTAYEFTGDGDILIYGNFRYFGTAGWSAIDQTTVLVTSIGGTQEKVTITLEKRSSIDYLILQDSTGILVFFRDAADEFSLEDTAISSDDAALYAAIADVTWHYNHYADSNGQLYPSEDSFSIYNTDGTFEDTFEGDAIYGKWGVAGGILYVEYSDGTTSSWIVEVKDENGIYYLYIYDSQEDGFWLYSDRPVDSDAPPANPTTSKTYTTDSEMSSVITGLDWHEMYYVYPDGSTDTMNPNTMYFYSDGSFDDISDGENSVGTWHFEDGNLYLYYPADDENYYYPTYIEYNAESASWYIYLSDLEEGYEGGHWIYTTYEP